MAFLFEIDSAIVLGPIEILETHWIRLNTDVARCTNDWISILHLLELANMYLVLFWLLSFFEFVLRKVISVDLLGRELEHLELAYFIAELSDAALNSDDYFDRENFGVHMSCVFDQVVPLCFNLVDLAFFTELYLNR